MDAPRRTHEVTAYIDADLADWLRLESVRRRISEDCKDPRARSMNGVMHDAIVRLSRVPEGWKALPSDVRKAESPTKRIGVRLTHDDYMLLQNWRMDALMGGRSISLTEMIEHGLRMLKDAEQGS